MTKTGTNGKLQVTGLVCRKNFKLMGIFVLESKKCKGATGATHLCFKLSEQKYILTVCFNIKMCVILQIIVKQIVCVFYIKLHSNYLFYNQ